MYFYLTNHDKCFLQPIIKKFDRDVLNFNIKLTITNNLSHTFKIMA
jgi:hypothetical protein